MKTIILAAGYGRRLKPITNMLPKPLVKIGEKPLLQHILEKLSAEGVQEFYINLHHFADQIKVFLDNKRYADIDIKLSFETELLDTGGGIKRIVERFSITEPVLVYNVDIMSTIPTNELMRAHLNYDNIATMAIQDRPTDKYLLFDEESVFCGRATRNKKVSNLVRQPTGNMNSYAFCGIYVIEPQFFKEYYSNTFSSIDLFLEQTSLSNTVKGIQYDDFFWSDVGTLKELEKTKLILKSTPNLLQSNIKV